MLDLLELLKKLGISSVLGAIIAAALLVIPILFKIDDRYAKDADIKADAARNERALNIIATEIGKLAGTQEALILMIETQEIRTPKISMSKPEVLTPNTKFTVLSEMKKDTRLQQARIQSFKY